MSKSATKIEWTEATDEKSVTVTIIARGDNENTPEEAVHHALAMAHKQGFIIAWSEPRPTPHPNPFGELVERLTSERILMDAMARNYRGGHRTDHLDIEAFERAREAMRDAATAIETQAAEIERLQDEADEAKTWPEWAEKILKVLQSHGAAEPDEDGIDLPEALSEWMEGYESATSSEITTLKARIAELEKERDEAAKETLPEAMDKSLMFVRDKLDEIKTAKGLIGLYCDAFRAGWFSASRASEARLKDALKVIEAVNASAVLFASGKTLKEYAISGDVLQQVEAFLQSLSTTGGDSHG